MRTVVSASRSSGRGYVPVCLIMICRVVNSISFSRCLPGAMPIVGFASSTRVFRSTESWGGSKPRPGVARLLYMAGGTIADRGYYTLRLEGSLARLGELDEEFVWERSLGDSFTSRRPELADPSHHA